MAERPLGAMALYEALLRAYGEPRWWSEDAYTVLFQSVLVQNTAWGNVEKKKMSRRKRFTGNWGFHKQSRRPARMRRSPVLPGM